MTGSVLAPEVLAAAARVRNREDQRQKQAVAIMQHGIEDNSRLNQMRTVLASRLKHTMSHMPAAPADLIETNTSFWNHYNHFNGIAWYWAWNIHFEATIGGLLRPTESGHYSTLANEYVEMLSTTTAVLFAYREAAVDRSPPTPAAWNSVNAEAAALDRRLAALERRRVELLNEMSQQFTKPEPWYQRSR
jgi:hypothetical protein